MVRWFSELWLEWNLRWSPALQKAGAPTFLFPSPTILPFPALEKRTVHKPPLQVPHQPLRADQLSPTLEWDNLYIAPRGSAPGLSSALATPTKPSLGSTSLSPIVDVVDLETPWSKRVLDVVFCLILLVILAPLFLLIALLIKLQDGGPIFFRSVRIGKDGIPFDFYKFRTMVVQAETMKAALLAQNLHGRGITFKMRNDPRVTPIGVFLRRWSLDELPQFWNVLIGDMSLVGPRPAVPEEVARYSPRDRDRLSVLPGLTCIWQVSGRSEIPFEQQVELDRLYIKNRSFWLDLQLLLLTPSAIIKGKGAY